MKAGYLKFGTPVLVTGGAWEGRAGRVWKTATRRATVIMSPTEAWTVWKDDFLVISEEELLVREVMGS
jgi:hypothetical protein